MSDADLAVSPDTQVHTWEVRAERADEFRTKIEQANRKLERSGLGARFTVSYNDFEKRYDLDSGALIAESDPTTTYLSEHWVRAELSGPLRLSHGHFTFVAALVPEEAGMTVHSAPGQELGGFTPRGDDACEHCNLQRRRTRLYLVRDERDGSIMQLGHSCIELYTGVSPKGLWALTFDEELHRFASSDRCARGPAEASVDAVLAYAYAHSEQGRSYQAVTVTGWGTSTAGQVRTSLFGDINRLRAEQRNYYIAKAAEAATYARNAALLDAIKASVETTAADSDYGRNLRVVLGGETVSHRNIGILASLVKVYARASQLEVQRAAVPAVSGFIGEVGQRVRNISGIAKTVVYSEGFYGTKTFLVAIADTGHTLVWSASARLDIEVGDRFTMAAATVKEHGEFNGADQTVVTRPAKFSVLRAEVAA